MSSWNDEANQIFVEAVGLEAGTARNQFLAARCGSNAALRQLVDSLIDADARAGEDAFLADPAATRLREVGAAAGKEIGPYKLLQELGEGGFGVVFMAEQKGSLQRHVALKVIKPGMDSREVIARFEVERQALALMDHPNVAKVFDAGSTEEGLPYFVMELVKGIPITEFCDKNRLSNRDRLELFRAVCNAVHHAHQKGVIHRDIKPSNVLVTLHDGKPVPKIIDFGIAKATSQRLTEKTLFTRFGQMVGTPQYMSPEQAEMSGLDVDTRADIYSLGVLLYELLTGTTPIQPETLRSAGWKEVMRLIQEEDTQRPSHRLRTMGQEISAAAENRKSNVADLRASVAGELDWIVMKALEKDRNLRYPSAVALADDVLRFLDDEPVEASPPSAAYRLRKFVKRNRGLAFTVAAIAATLLIGLGLSTYGLLEARRESAKARTEADKSAAVLAITQDLIYSHAGSGAETVAMLDSLAKSLPTVMEKHALADSKEVEAEIRYSLGHKYHSLEYVEKARKQFRLSLQLARQAYPAQDLRLTRIMREFVWSLTNGWALADTRLYRKEAESIAAECVEIDRANGKDPQHSRVIHAGPLMMQNRAEEAGAIYEELVRVATSDAGLATRRMCLAGCYIRQDRFEDAIEMASLASQHGQGAVAATAMTVMASAFYQIDKFQQAEETFGKALEAYRAPRKSVFFYVDTIKASSTTLLALGRFDRAETLLLEALADCREERHTPHELLVLRGLANLYLFTGRVAEAERLFQEMVKLAQRELGPANFETVLAKARLAKVHLLRDRPELADPLFESCQTPLREFARQGGDLPDLVADWASSVAHCTSSSPEQLKEAIDSLPDLQAIPRYQRHTGIAAVARAHARLGQSETAIRMLLAARDELAPGETFDVIHCERLLLELVREHGSEAEIKQAYEDAIAYRQKYMPDCLGTHLAVVRFGKWQLAQDDLPADSSELKEALEACRQDDALSDQDRELVRSVADRLFERLGDEDKSRV